MQKVLVFGGAGFLGFYLSKELVNRGYNVTVADLKEFESNDIHFKYIDISDHQKIEELLGEGSFDIVYNLAGLANLDVAVNYPLKTMELNVIANMAIMDSCIKYNVKKYVYASSAYAVSNKGSFYGISKLASEKIIEEYHKRYNLNFIILRYGSVYSERSYDNNYIFNIVKEAVSTKKIKHKGDGEEVREYIHAADAAKLSVDVIENSSFDNVHVILTGTERMKRIELFNMIKEILNDEVVIECDNSGYNNHYRFTPYSFVPTISKKLIANPHIDMGQGLLECVMEVYNNKL